MLFSRGSATDVLSSDDLRGGLHAALAQLGERKRVLIIPPDHTRSASRAGELTRYACEFYGDRVVGILPALGTHVPMTGAELRHMFGDVPEGLFRVHDWRNDVVTLGEVAGSFVRDVSGGVVDYPWPAQVNRMLVDPTVDLILSIGQVVPHEVAGMANFTKNIFVGTGGSEGINRSHFLGAAYGMEQIMGRADNPVRAVLNQAWRQFASHLPLVFVHTVVGRNCGDSLAVRGLFIGTDEQCFTDAARLSLAVNFTMLDKPIRKAVVHLDPQEFRSTWLGNKAIYRTRMAMADGGELIVLAPGVRQFGEDPEIDRLIRAYGYCGTSRVLDLVKSKPDLRANLSAAAHLIHGSSDGRFRVTYCPGHLTAEEVQGVGFEFANLPDSFRRYDPGTLHDGYNTLADGEEVFFVSNPAIGLWAWKERFAG